VVSVAFWALSGAKRWRGMRCGLVYWSVRAPPYAPADGARAVGLLAGVCLASGADRASGGFWRVLGGFWRVMSVWGRLPPWKAWIETNEQTGVIEAVAFPLEGVD
jgi:hypothetical protein